LYLLFYLNTNEYTAVEFTSDETMYHSVRGFFVLFSCDYSRIIGTFHVIPRVRYVRGKSIYIVVRSTNESFKRDLITVNDNYQTSWTFSKCWIFVRMPEMVFVFFIFDSFLFWTLLCSRFRVYRFLIFTTPMLFT